MKHITQKRMVSGADTAVLFIHGISGTPRHFEQLIPIVPLVPQEWSLYNLTLPGHGGSVTDFSSSSMSLWKKETQRVFCELSEIHERIVLVGHSMGTLFAADLASKNPRKVCGLFLLAVPLYPKFQISNSARLLRLAFGCLRENDPRDRSLFDACGVEPTWKLWDYLGWIPRFLELFLEIDRSRAMFSNLKCPAVIFQSGQDELVSRRSEKLLQKNQALQLAVIHESGHFYYEPRERERVLNAFKVFVEGIKKHD